MLDYLHLYKDGINSNPSICTYAIRPSLLQIPATGGTASVSLDTAPSCHWDITGLPIWAHSTGSGNGSGSARITVAPNETAAGRSVDIRVGGQAVRLSQDAPSVGPGPITCTYSLSSTSASVGAGRSSATVNLSAPPDCAWSAVSNNADWLSFISGSSGQGSGSVNFQFSDNATASSRIGTLSIAGLKFTVTQAGSSGTDTTLYNFEGGTQGWVASDNTLATISVSDLHSFDGNRSLAVFFSGTSAQKVQVYVPTPPVKPGMTVRFRIWIPAGSSPTAINPFIMDKTWKFTGNWQSITNIKTGAWTTLSVIIPTNAATLASLGVEFSLGSNRWSGTCYLDSVGP